MTSSVEAARAEVIARIAATAAAHEGLRDYMSLDLQDEAKREVAATLADYDRMLALEETFRIAADALIAAGYPDLAPREIPAAALTDLQAQVETITAARAQFLSAAATALELTAGAPEPKS